MNYRGKSITFGERTHIMGILNVTPDSFSDGGAYLNVEAAVGHAKEMVAQGATLIDIGGESSRPGAMSVSVDEELRRVLPVIRALTSEGIEALLSIDTTKAAVAQHALEAGAHIINDITALRGDTAMARVALEMEAGIILMHMKGTPRTMQRDPHYDNVVKEIYDTLAERIHAATQHGIAPDKVIVDPGIGFGKTTEHNLQILRHLDIFKRLDTPILIGTSRKSFIGNVLNLPVEERVEGTVATVCWAIAHGADIVRVHDVQATARAAKMMDALYR